MQEQPGPDACRVTIADTGQSFLCDPGMAILDAGLIAGIGLPHNCRGGACGTCKSEVLEGSVDHGWVLSFAITDEEKAAGKCLICQSKPTSADARDPARRRGGAGRGGLARADRGKRARGRERGAHALDPAPGVALPKGVRFRYRAGMHVEIATPGVAKPRTYSIANAPATTACRGRSAQFFVTRHRGRARQQLAA